MNFTVMDPHATPLKDIMKQDIVNLAGGADPAGVACLLHVLAERSMKAHLPARGEDSLGLHPRRP